MGAHVYDPGDLVQLNEVDGVLFATENVTCILLSPFRVEDGSIEVFHSMPFKGRSRFDIFTSWVVGGSG
jgi:hypothetical protein